MVSLPEELQEREAAARRRVELQARMDELALRLEKPREDLSRFVITRKTVAEVLAESARGHPPRRGEERGGRPARPLAPGEKPNRKRMASVACVFDTVPAPRRPHDIVHPPGGRSGPVRPRPGPKAQPEMVHRLGRSAPRNGHRRRLRPGRRPRPATICGPGSSSSTAPATNSTSIHAEAARRGVHGARPDRLRARRRILLDGRPRLPPGRRRGRPRPAPPTNSPRSWPDTPPTRRRRDDHPGPSRTASSRPKRAGRHLRAATSPATSTSSATTPPWSAGWPIATGAVEGACRHLIADRLDITGARWGADRRRSRPPTPRPVTNGDFDTYWTTTPRMSIGASIPRPTSRATTSPRAPTFTSKDPHPCWLRADAGHVPTRMDDAAPAVVRSVRSRTSTHRAALRARA